MADLATALGLVLVLEGVLWAVAPDGMKRAAAMAAAVDSAQIRSVALVVAAVGLLLVWLIRG